MNKVPNPEPSCDVCTGVRQRDCDGIVQETKIRIKMDNRSLGRLSLLMNPDDNGQADNMTMNHLEGILDEYRQKMRGIGCILDDVALELKLINSVEG